MTNDWKQLPNEPAIWFERFIQYYVSQIGYRDVFSAEKLYLQCLSIKNKTYYTPPLFCSQEWLDASEAYQWEQRAIAYEQWINETARIDEINQLIAYKRSRQERFEYQNATDALIQKGIREVVEMALELKELEETVKHLDANGDIDTFEIARSDLSIQLKYCQDKARLWSDITRANSQHNKAILDTTAHGDNALGVTALLNKLESINNNG
jgi:hypothetical protein